MILFVSAVTFVLCKFTPLICAESLSISLVSWGFFATICEISRNKNSEFQIANRYRYKALWYGAVSFSSIFIFIANISESLSKGLLVFNIMVVFIAIHECVDNISSFKVEKQKLIVEKQKLNKKNSYNEEDLIETCICNKQQQTQPVRDKYKNDKTLQKDYEIGILKSISIAFLVTIIGIIASTEKNK